MVQYLSVLFVHISSLLEFDRWLQLKMFFLTIILVQVSHFCHIFALFENVYNRQYHAVQSRLFHIDQHYGLVCAGLLRAASSQCVLCNLNSQLSHLA